MMFKVQFLLYVSIPVVFAHFETVYDTSFALAMMIEAGYWLCHQNNATEYYLGFFSSPLIYKHDLGLKI